jgi:hypothetical protein
MLKLVYDLKAGFEDKYLTLKNEECELSGDLVIMNLGTLDNLEEIEADTGEAIDVDTLREPDEEAFYNEYKDDIEGLLDYIESIGTLESIYECSVLEISKLYFSHLLGSKYIVPIWEPSNWRLVYDPAVRTSVHYLNALPAKEVCDTLKLTRQQLHYYVKAGQIRKEFNPENPKQFKYNRTDVYVLQKKLEKKYDRYKD